MIEHFSKWLELAPLLNQNNEKPTYAFLDIMFSRLGVHFHHIFYYSIMTLNYQPPFDVMLWYG